MALEFGRGNIGVATGNAVVGIDFDTKPGAVGLDSLPALEAALGPLPATLTTVTGGGGQHRYFRVPAGQDVQTNAGKLAPGIDIRGRGGFLVAPPSVHPNGTSYSWLERHGPCEIRIAQLPAPWLRRLHDLDGRGSSARAIQRPQATPTAASGEGSDLLSAEVKAVAETEEPGRNDRLFAATVTLRRYVLAGELATHVVTERLVAAATAAGLEESDARATIASGLRPPSDAGEEDKRVIILMPGRMSKVVEEAEKALVEADIGLFQRNHKLVRVLTDPDTGLPGIHALDKHALHVLLGKHILWRRPSRNPTTGDSAADPPISVADQLLHKGTWLFHVLRDLVNAPTLRPDGSVLDAPGYDASTRLLLTHALLLPSPVPASPTLDDARAALAELQSAVDDFCFRADADRAVAVAAIVTVLVRTAVEGPVPLFLFNSNTPGSGKSLLADVVSHIALGIPAARLAEVDNAEFEKRMTAFLMEGKRLILLDNIANGIGGPALDAALTGRRWAGRVLGRSESVDIVMSLVVLATGNNVHMKGDVSRRTLQCYLDPKMERPEERGGFRHDPLLPWIQAHRAELVRAGLVLASAYMLNGRGAVSLSPFGSFEAWSDLVRSALVWAGSPDPVATQHALRRDHDPRVDAWETVLSCAEQAFGLRSFQAVELAAHGRSGVGVQAFARASDLRFALQVLVDDDDPKPRAIGGAFATWQGRMVAGRKLVKEGARGAAGNRWRVEVVQQQQVQGV